MKDLADSIYIPIKERYENAIDTGFNDIDNHIKGLKQQEITILFGRNGEGKSTFASQLLAYHISKGNRAYLYSGELGESKIQEWLYKQIIGYDEKFYNKVMTKYDNQLEIKHTVLTTLKEWHRHRLFIYNMKLDKIQDDTEILFEDMNNALTCGVTLFLIDNLMTAYTINERTQYSDQANFVQDCKDFARDNNVHIIIICHPNKSQQELPIDAKVGNLAKNDVSGSGNISNKADNVISIERIWKEKNVNYEDEYYDALVTVLKEREGGERATYGYWFGKKSLRFYNGKTSIEANIDWQGKGNQSKL